MKRVCRNVILPFRSKSFALDRSTTRIDHHIDSISFSLSREKEKENSIESLSLPLLLQGFTRVRLARIMQSLEEREMEERDRERKKRDYAAVPRGHVINDTRGGRIIFITTNS